MQLAWSPEDEAFRTELIAFLDAHTPEQMRTGYDFQDVGDERELVPRGCATGRRHCSTTVG